MTRIQHEHRLAWLEQRLRLEARLAAQHRRSTVLGERRHRAWLPPLFEAIVGASVRLAGLHRRGLANARTVLLNRVEMRFPHLPDGFDGFRILHLSDMHVGTVPGLTEAMLPVLAEADADLAVITGDFQSMGWPEAPVAARMLAPVVEACRRPQGLFAVLGNHDSAGMAAALEALGVRMLLNESVTLRRGAGEMHVAGTDDVHFFHTPAAPAALAARREGFRIALVHSAELAHEAERLGYALYLSGHTHGGQICLPGGMPVMTALDRHRALARGVWRMGGLQGYTLAGTGSGTPALRFNSRPEIAVVTLRQG